MKVIHRSDALLMIEDRPWLIGAMMILAALLFLFGGMALIGQGQLIGGLAMILIGAGVPLLMAALMVQRVRVTFDRTSGRLTRTVRSVRGLHQTVHALDRLTAARVGAKSDGDGTAYRLELVLDGPAEVLPFTICYSGGRRAERLCAEVSDWLGSWHQG